MEIWAACEAGRSGSLGGVMELLNVCVLEQNTPLKYLWRKGREEEPQCGVPTGEEVPWQ